MFRDNQCAFTSFCSPVCYILQIELLFHFLIQLFMTFKLSIQHQLQQIFTCLQMTQNQLKKIHILLISVASSPYYYHSRHLNREIFLLLKDNVTCFFVERNSTSIKLSTSISYKINNVYVIVRKIILDRFSQYEIRKKCPTIFFYLM